MAWRLAISTLVAGDIAAGLLIKPFELALKSPPQFAYHLITRKDMGDRPIVKTFRNWILEEAQTTDAPSKN